MVKPKIDREVQIAVYKKYRSDIIDKNGKVKPCSDKIYNLLAKELDGMSVKAIQTAISRNLSNIAGDLGTNDCDVEEHEKVPSDILFVNTECISTDGSSSPLSNSYTVPEVDLNLASESEVEDDNSEVSSILVPHAHSNESLKALYHKTTHEDLHQIRRNVDRLEAFFIEAEKKSKEMIDTNRSLSNEKTLLLERLDEVQHAQTELLTKYVAVLREKAVLATDKDRNNETVQDLRQSLDQLKEANVKGEEALSKMQVQYQQAMREKAVLAEEKERTDETIEGLRQLINKRDQEIELMTKSMDHLKEANVKGEETLSEMQAQYQQAVREKAVLAEEKERTDETIEGLRQLINKRDQEIELMTKSMDHLKEANVKGEETLSEMQAQHQQAVREKAVLAEEKERSDETIEGLRQMINKRDHEIELMAKSMEQLKEANVEGEETRSELQVPSPTPKRQLEGLIRPSPKRVQRTRKQCKKYSPLL